eukprot:7312778-Pyramimonas_sp.AAC.1
MFRLPAIAARHLGRVELDEPPVAPRFNALSEGQKSAASSARSRGSAQAWRLQRLSSSGYHGAHHLDLASSERGAGFFSATY